MHWVVPLPGAPLSGYVQASITGDRTAHIAYELASRFWRQGIGSTAVAAMLAELQAMYGVSTFAATLKADNHRSLALLRSLGFSPEPPQGLSAVDLETDEIVMYRVDSC